LNKTIYGSLKFPKILLCFQNHISEFLNLQSSLKRQLQLTAFNHNIGEIQQMDFQRVQHSLPCDNNLSGLFINRQGSDQSSHFFSSFPLGQLAQSLLTRPSRSVDYFQVQLSVSRVENENRAVNWLCCQVPFESLVNCHTVNVCVVHEPDYLVGEQFGVVLRI
jgi:hypothetical protein